MPVGSYYLLLEAYDLLGRRLYGRTWTGTEITAAPLRPPEEIAAEREALTGRIETLDTRLAELRAEQMRLVQEDALADNEREGKALLHQRQNLATRLERIPVPDEQYGNDYAARQRRVETERRLIAALAEGELSAIIGFQLELPRHVWRGERGFKCYLDLSLAVVPRTMSAKRHDSVLLRTDAFDAWAETTAPIICDDPEQISPEALCVGYLREVARQGPKALTKRHLKDRWGIASWADLDAKAGDVFRRTLTDIRYTCPTPDSNRARWPEHPLWAACRRALDEDLFEMTANADPGVVKRVHREDHAEMLMGQLLGLSATWAALVGFSPDHTDGIPAEIAKRIANAQRRDPERYAQRMGEALKRYAFL